jgi:DinB family protein
MIGRPQDSEAAPYYFTYINQVQGDDPLRIIESQLEPSMAFFSGISEEKSLHRYAPEKWSIRQTLGHITDTERVMALRAFWFARGFDTPLPSFDQLIAVPAAESDRVSWAAHMEEFQRVRLATISLFANLPPAAWMRTGIASDNRFTVRALAFCIAGHVSHHMAVVRERYLQGKHTG